MEKQTVHKGKQSKKGKKIKGQEYGSLIKKNKKILSLSTKNVDFRLNQIFWILLMHKVVGNKGTVISCSAALYINISKDSYILHCSSAHQHFKGQLYPVLLLCTSTFQGTVISCTAAVHINISSDSYILHCCTVHQHFKWQLYPALLQCTSTFLQFVEGLFLSSV